MFLFLKCKFLDRKIRLVNLFKQLINISQQHPFWQENTYDDIELIFFLNFKKKTDRFTTPFKHICPADFPSQNRRRWNKEKKTKAHAVRYVWLFFVV